jgi:hypothetical protein
LVCYRTTIAGITFYLPSWTTAKDVSSLVMEELQRVTVGCPAEGWRVRRKLFQNGRTHKTDGAGAVLGNPWIAG